MSERDNRRVWAPDRHGCYEVWYATWNHPSSGEGYWLRFITEAPQPGSRGVPPFGEAARGELWFARFDPRTPSRTFGIHKRFSDVSSVADPFSLTIAGCELGDDHTFGELHGGGHDVRWDLRWHPSSDTLRFYPDVFYGGPHGRNPTMALSPNPRVPLSGTLLVDGEEIVFDRAIAGQSHVWGKKHSNWWTWAHCTSFAGAPDALLEVVGGKVERGALRTPNLVSVSLDLDGERYRLNQVRHLLLNRATWRTGHVEVVARSATVRIEVELSCSAERLINAPYVDPDGEDVFCANTEIGDAQVVLSKRSGLGWRQVRRLESRGGAHFETGSRVRDPAVTRPHVLVT